MSRPLRIEYENAIYHVMNRGRGRRVIFHGKDYTQLFLQCLAEAAEQFGLEILAYCLISNHYHLLVRTPYANLSRCMRHVNGLYTQRYNRLQKTDGPLFRGRYKAIVVDTDTYLLPVSRYIHRNPIAMKKPLVTQLKSYRDSSYLAYLNRVKSPAWLKKELVLSALNTPHPYQAYEAFVEDDNTPSLNDVYAKTQLPTILGTKAFITHVKNYAKVKDKEISIDALQEKSSLQAVVTQVANYFNVNENQILHAQRGAGKKNVPRRIAMYLCQRYARATLQELADYFGVTHYSTVSQTLRRLKRDRQSDKTLAKVINVLRQNL